MLTREINQWLEKHIGPVREAKALVGGISTSVYRLSLANGESCVLRVYDNEEMLQEEPDFPHREAAALRVVEQGKLKAPKLMCYEADAAVCGLPLLAMQALEGEVILKPADMDTWLKRMAEALGAIHALDVPDFAWEYSRYFELDDTPVPVWTSFPQNWHKALEILGSPEPDSPRCFIHRDYHPANILWHNGEISGVVDWVNGCIGTAGYDVGHMRVNLVSLYNYEIADEFLAIYQAVQPNFEYEPYWDFLALGDFYLTEDDAPEVYNPWLDLGMSHLSHALMLKNAEDYLKSLLARY